MELHGFRDLIVFQKSYKLSLEVYKISSKFPKEEKYSLIDQIRRSSRSICVNLAESWAKRIYLKAFVNKISDAFGEELETEVWLNMCFDLQYINAEIYNDLSLKYDEIRRMLIAIMNNPGKFCK